jgi:hypothetical protein
MLVPIEPNLECIIGADYYDTFFFWADKAKSDPFDFADYTDFRFTIGPRTLTEGDGLVIDRENGSISPTIDRTVTASVSPGTQTYKLTTIDPNGKLGFLMLGVFTWRPQ